MYKVVWFMKTCNKEHSNSYIFHLDNNMRNNRYRANNVSTISHAKQVIHYESLILVFQSYIHRSTTAPVYGVIDGRAISQYNSTCLWSN